jgi:FimV-like protein
LKLETVQNSTRLQTFMKRSLFSLTAAFCLVAFLAVPRPAYAKDSWISVQSKNFRLIGNGNEKQIRQVAIRLEQFREVFSRLFPSAVLSTPVPTTVVVFKSDNSYRPFKPNATTLGYFQSGEDVNYITLTTETQTAQDPFNVIFHEYTHLMVNNTLGKVPTWFSEGLAEYYSTASISDDQKVVLGRPIGSHVYLLRQKKMLPLRTLFQVDHKSPHYNERDKQTIFYAQSWALVHFLILGNGGQRVEQMSKFLQLTAANVPMEEAFQKAFNTTFESLEGMLRNYIQNDRYPIVSGHFERKLELEGEMLSEPLTEAQVQAYLGDLLLHSNRADAEGYLKKALDLDPDLAMAHASMGMLRVREGKAEAARKSLERAVAADSQNYLIHYYYAYAISRGSEDQTGMVYGFPPADVTRMRAALNRAIELRPDFIESARLLAFVNLVTMTQLDESIQMLKAAQRRARGRNDLSYLMAQLYLAKQDYKTARELLHELSGSGEEDLRQRAQTLLIQIVSMEENATRVRETQRRSGSGGPPVLIPAESGEAQEGKEVDPSSYLREALRGPEAGETQVQGLLVRIDCDQKGLTFVVKVDKQLLKLRTAKFQDVDMTSYSPDAGRQITCGPRAPESNVVVSYVASTDARAKADGEAKTLQFVPQDFKLKP